MPRVVPVLRAAAGADTARASCGPEPTQDALRRADGAFVGIVESIRSGQDGRETSYVMRVERVFKGAFGATAEVRDRHGLSSISLRAAVGDRFALLIGRDDRGLHATDCDRTTEEALEEGTRGSCRAAGRPPRGFYRRRPAAPGARYRVRPRVVGCGRTGSS